MNVFIKDVNDLMSPLFPGGFSQGTDVSFKALLTWGDTFPHHPDIDQAREMNIPIFIFQHGRRSSLDYLLCEPRGDYFLVWGTEDEKVAQEVGWPKERIFRTGAPWIESIPRRETAEFIVFNAVKSDRNIEMNYDIWGKLHRLPNTIIKILTEDHEAYKFRGRKFQTNRFETGHTKKCWELLQRTRVVISSFPSSFDLMAYALGIPVVYVLPGVRVDEFFGMHIDGRNSDPDKAVIKTNLRDLKSTIKNVVSDIRMQHDVLLAEAGDIYHDRPKEAIMKIIKEHEKPL